jgi:hypothetical protein
MKKMRQFGLVSFFAGESALVFLLLSVLVSCHGKTVPSSMVGLWVTDDPPYQDCSIEITADRIAYRDPLMERPETGAMQKVVVKKEDSTQSITLYYVNPEGVDFKRQVIYSAQNGGCFWFKNQPKIMWKHTKAPPADDVQQTPQTAPVQKEGPAQ